MAILDLVAQDVIAKYPATPITALIADFVFTAAGADFADGARFPHTGREIIIVEGRAGAETLTLNSAIDSFNRLGTITTYAVGINLYCAFGPFPVAGWRQADGYFTMEASAADVSFAILKLAEG